MALFNMIAAEACVAICDTTRTISEDDFLDYLIGVLSDSITPVTDVTPANIQDGVDEALCAMEGRKNSTISVEQKRALVLGILASQ